MHFWFTLRNNSFRKKAKEIILNTFYVSRQLEPPPKKLRKFGTIKRANHSVCFITAQLLAGASEKWSCIHLYQISLFSLKQSEIWYEINAMVSFDYDVLASCLSFSI